MKDKSTNKISTPFFVILALILFGATIGTAATSLRANGKIAFTSDRDGNREIYIIDRYGSRGDTRITNNSIVDDHPTWSPDGLKIAFLSQSESGAYAIFVMNADGTGRMPITLVNYQVPWPWNGWDAWKMSWSSDGQSIVFTDGSVQASTIVIVNVDGSNRRDLTSGFGPAWSPDGSKILFLRTGDGSGNRIHTIRTDGSDLRDITPNFPGYPVSGWAPIWSPDGSKIAYGSFDGANSSIIIANQDGSSPQEFLTHCAELVPQGCSSVQLPAWSPDGRTMAFVSWGHQSGAEIYTANIPGSSTITRLTNSSGINSNPNWQPLAYRATADFDGDGRADISVFRPSDSVWYLDRSTDGFTAARFGLSTDRITPADFDGDGKTDIAVYREGTWYWLNSSNGTVGVDQFGIPGDVPVPADYTGDGRDELAVYRDGVWWTKDMTNGQTSVVQFGLPSDRPVPADYDGDGRIDQAVYRDGEWHMNRSSLGYTVVQFGLSEDKPVAGDYDGDGKADCAVYRSGTWYLMKSTEGFAAFQWGVSTDIPVAADYDGDGRTDATVFRSGTWWILGSTGSVRVQQFGLGGDKPIPAAGAF